MICHRSGHFAEQCAIDGFRAEMMRARLEQVKAMEEPMGEQGRYCAR